MMKKIPFKMDSKGRTAIKEVIYKAIKSDETRLKVTFGVDAELKILEPCIFKEKICVNSGVLAGNAGMTLKDYLMEHKKSNKSIYYALDSLTYICTVSLVLEQGVVKKKAVNIYVPTSIADTDILCKDVSVIFSSQVRNALVDTYLEYTLFRAS